MNPIIPGIIIFTIFAAIYTLRLLHLYLKIKRLRKEINLFRSINALFDGRKEK